MTIDPERTRLLTAWCKAEAIALEATTVAQESQAEAEEAFDAFYEYKESLK
jgi:hypothetical protein